LPAIFDTYGFGGESHLTARVRQIDAKRQEPNSLSWVVTVDYSTPDPEKPEKQQEYEDPLLADPVITLHAEKFQEIVYEGLDTGNNPIPVTNSAEEVFDQPPVKDQSRFVI